MTRTFRTEAGEETTKNALDVHSVRYTVVTPIAIDAPSVEEIIVIKDTTKATIEVTLPADKQLSTSPISGTFYAKCYHPDGSIYET